MLTRWRAIRAVAVFLVSVVLVLYFASRLFILRSFENLERQVAQTETTRLNSTLGERLATLDSKTGDWGTWTEAYDYMGGTNPEFVTTEVTDATMTQLRVNLIALFDLSGKLVFARGFDLEKKKEQPFRDGDRLQFEKFLQNIQTDSKLSGVVLLTDAPMLIAARPIVTNEGKGPPRGAMVFGRDLDSLELAQLGLTTHLNLSIYRLDQKLPTDELVSARTALSTAEPFFVQPLNNQLIASYLLVSDIYGNPALVFRSEESRDIYRQGENSTNYFLVSLSLIAAIFAVVAVALAERLIRSQQKERESEELYYTLAEAAPDAIFVVDRDARVKFANASAARDLMNNWQTILGDQFGPESLGNSEGNVRQVLDANAPLHIERRVKISNKETWLDIKMVPLPGENGNSESVLGIARDITERKQAEVQVHKQMRRLRALHAVDEAITSIANISFTLKRLLHHTVVELNADAADVLLLEPDERTFRCETSIGFHSGFSPREVCSMQDQLAGGAVQALRTVVIQNLKEQGDRVYANAALATEGIVQCAATPLIVKGRVRGVLEVFHRESFEPNPEWLDFFQTLARQAAIAVDYSETTTHLQQANHDLETAYDLSLEGWIRALDLREGEKEEHSLQVADLTVRLARALGIGEPDLVHVRRGALLHDIGKIAIPDSILLNQQVLTDSERRVMQEHPAHGQAMLASIPFLQHALDIPYCHHEKWDGTGYPRGLAGEAIPLAARLFAVVDAWDALRSSRPYRAPWETDKIAQHLSEQSGKQFDPRVVEEFLKIIQS